MLIALLATACAAPVSPGQESPSPQTGIRGVSTIDGGCPVIRSDSPCPDKPYPAGITITESGHDDTIASTTSTSDGAFSVALPPGQHTLHPQPVSGASLPHAAEVTVAVANAGYAEVTISFDSGIR